MPISTRLLWEPEAPPDADARRAPRLSWLPLAAAAPVAAAALLFDTPLVLGLAAALLAVPLCAYMAVRATGLALWQIAALPALTGYVVLNYGFSNFCVPGTPVPVGYVLMLGALGLSSWGHARTVAEMLREPALISFLPLLFLTAAHLTGDLPEYGLYAFRDASVFLEALFLIPGWVWGRTGRRTRALWRGLLGILVINLFYSLTYPWERQVIEMSPPAGVFQQVTLLGAYMHSYLYLLAGALYCLWPARHVVRWPRWVLLVLAVLQLLGLAIHQARSTYVAIPIIAAVLLATGQSRKVGKILAIVLVAGVVLYLAPSFGLEAPGRMGPVTIEFLIRHSESMLLREGTQDSAVGSIRDRAGFYNQIWSRVTTTLSRFLFGEGFGQPLIDFATGDNVPVRQPHNTHLSVLARVGLLGTLFWALFHLLAAKRFADVLLRRRRYEPEFFEWILWLFLYFLVSLLVTTVQPHLEFSHGAIPYYFLLGVALGMMRRREAEAREGSMSP